MKYPQAQFNVLAEVLTELSKHFEIKNIHASNLHFIVYQQLDEGQKQNKLVICDGFIKRAHQCEGLQVEPLIKTNYNFELYPQGCNDNHVITAVNKVLTIIDKNHI